MSSTPTASPNKKGNAAKVAAWSSLEERKPAYALVANVDLVVIRYGDEVSVLYGRCLHRGALLADGSIDGDNLICGVHGWDYRVKTGVSAYNNDEALHKFDAWVDTVQDAVFVDEDEVATSGNAVIHNPTNGIHTRGYTRTSMALRRNPSTNTSRTLPRTA